MKAGIGFCLIMLAGCTPFSAYRPNIDMHGVDLNRYEADMRDCESKSAGSGFEWGNPIAKCMVGRGYKLSHTY